MKSTIQSVEEYICGYSGQVKKELEDLRRIILESDPAVTEKIAWGAPTYYLNGYLAQFAAARRHIGFYTSQTTLQAFADELKGYQTNQKNTVRFPVDQEIPAGLVKRMVQFRIQENTEHQEGRMVNG